MLYAERAKKKGTTQLTVIPIDTAVSWESPVIIFTATPELMSVATASFTPARGGSMMPTSPTNVSAPISDPDANASTARRKGENQWLPKQLQCLS